MHMIICFPSASESPFNTKSSILHRCHSPNAVNTYVFTYRYIKVYMYTSIHMYIYTHIYICTELGFCNCPKSSQDTQEPVAACHHCQHRVCKYISTYVCAYIHVYICACIYIHKYTCMHAYTFPHAQYRLDFPTAPQSSRETQ